jgi:hypothetical protein
VTRIALVAIVLAAAAFRIVRALVTDDGFGFFEYVAVAVLIAALVYVAVRARRSRPA